MEANLAQQTNRTVRLESDYDDEFGRPATPYPDYAATVWRLQREIAEIAGTEVHAQAIFPAGLGNSVRPATPSLDYAATLRRLESSLAEIAGDQPHAQAIFPEGKPGHPQEADLKKWKENRKITIETIDELIKKLDRTSFGCNMVTSAGSIADIAGSLMNTIGLDTLGSAAKITGGVVSTASTAAEYAITETYLSEVRRVIENDQEMSRRLLPWLDSSRNLYKDMSDIFGSNLLPAQLQRFVSLFLEFSTQYLDSTNLDQSLLIIQERMAALGIDLETMKSCVSKYALYLDKNPDLHHSMECIARYVSNSAFALERCQDGVNVINYILGPTWVKLPYLGFQEPLNLLDSLLTLLAAAKSLVDGKSQYTDKLHDLQKLLKLELKAMESY